jgi:hypothetical protein
MEYATSKELLGELTDQEFPDFESLEKGILDVFNENIDRVPPHYSYRQLLQFGERQGWIQQRGNKYVIVLVDGDSA